MTIYDIAKKAGVSSATVSRVLNKGPVKHATKKKILRVIKKENYIPDNRGVYLKKPNTKKVGLIVPDITNPGYPVSVKIIHDLLKSKGYHLILGNTYGEISEEKDILEMMLRERVAGLIVGTCEGEDDTSLYSLFKSLLENNIKIVFMGKKRDGLPIDVLSVDNTKGTYKITLYLLKTGRKKIGFIAGKKNLRATEERLDGYAKALREREISLNPEFVVCDGGYTMESGEKWGKELLKKDIDAVVCGNDLIAIGVLKAAEKMNIKIPDDISVTGFDDIFLSSLIRPGITTVRQPQEIAERGCEILIERIEGRKEGEPEEILFEPEIVIRESA
jgi:LacI family transcriptional regulator